jgi:hypothetical protein
MLHTFFFKNISRTLVYIKKHSTFALRFQKVFLILQPIQSMNWEPDGNGRSVWLRLHVISAVTVTVAGVRRTMDEVNNSIINKVSGNVTTQENQIQKAPERAYEGQCRQRA